MLTVEQLEPVVELVATADEDTAVEALGALDAMALAPEVHEHVVDAFAALVDDPRFDARRGELYGLLARVPDALPWLVEVADDPAAPGRDDALAALTDVDPGTWAPTLVRRLLDALGSDPAEAERLAALPLERCGVEPADLAPALDCADGTARLFAAVAAARAGSTDALDAALDAIAGGDVPELLWASPVEAYDRLAAVRPLPPELVEALLRRDPGEGPYAVVLWALTGVADAEGTPMRTAGPAPAAEPGEGTSAARVEALIAEVAAAEDPGTALAAGNDLMHLVTALPRPVELDVPAVLAAWQRSPYLPQGQLAAVLALADDDALLAALDADLRGGDADRQRDAARLLRAAVCARGEHAPSRGAGPGAGPWARPTRRLWREVEAFEPPEMSAPPTAEAPTAGMGEAPVEMAEPPMAEAPGAEASGGGGPAPEEVRRLQANVTEQATGVRRTHAFAPGVTHTLGVRIAPGDDGALAVAFDASRVVFDTPVGAILHVELVSEDGAGNATSQRQPLILPPSGPSAEAQFPLAVAAGADLVTCNVLVFQGARLLQSVLVEGPVAAVDEPVGGRSIAFVRDADHALVPAGRTEVEASLSFHVGGPTQALRVGADGVGSLVDLGGLRTFGDAIYGLLLQASNVDGSQPGAGEPGSAQQVELLRELARQGSMLYQALREQLGDTPVTRSIQLNSRGDDILPIEFAYDYGFPTRDAGLCDHWQEALTAGTCDCAPVDGSVPAVCPLGFWGVRLLVERNVVARRGEDGTTPAPARPGPDRVLRDVDRVLFAASSRVAKVSHDELDLTLALLAERLGDGCRAVTSWDEWRDTVLAHGPGLLLTMPHNATEEGELPVFEIGDDSRLELGAVTDAYVHQPGAEVGPVVMLLGCDTARSDVPWQSAVAAFRRRGATVVVGTLVQALGRQTAPMARLLIEAMWGADPVPDPTIGEVIRATRRRLLLRGFTLGMSLVAFGDGDWRVRPEVA